MLITSNNINKESKYVNITHDVDCKKNSQNFKNAISESTIVSSKLKT